MVIKAETVEMDIKSEKHDAEDGNRSNTDALSPPPSKRAKLNPPVHATPAASSLQTTLSSVIGSLSSQQLQILTTLISTISNENNVSSSISSGSDQTASATTTTTAEEETSSLTCDFCKETFLTASDYFKHITFSHDSDCLICQKSFQSQLELSKHISLQHSDNSTGSKTVSKSVPCAPKQPSGNTNSTKDIPAERFECEICGSVFGSHLSLEIHLKKFHKDHKPHSCFVCKEAFSTASQLFKHISFTHDLDCTYCQKSCQNAAQLKAHMMKEHHFECVVCKTDGITKVFSTVMSYDIHLEHYHEGVEMYKCISCNGRYVSITDFQNHVMEAHQGQNDITDSILHEEIKTNGIKSKAFKCSICEEEVGNEDKLHTHMKEKHANYCVYCRDTSVPEEELSQHVYSRHQRYCDLCDESFRAEYLILEHFQSQHKQLKITKCLFCDKSCLTAHQIIQHMKREHKANLLLPDTDDTASDEKKKAINCSLCDFTVDNVLDLQSHIRKMHDTRCDMCGRLFSTLRDLDIHIFLQHCFPCFFCPVHASSRPIVRFHVEKEHADKETFPCKICDEIFIKREELATHVTGHMTPLAITAGSRSPPVLPCVLCEMKFPNKKNLNEHLAKEHKMLFNCDICSNCFVSHTALMKHIEVYHDNIVFFNCNKCSKKTLSKPELTLHIQQAHKDDYEYTKCTLCDEEFSNQSDFFKHISFAHDSDASGEPDVQGHCSQCNTMFPSDTALAEHQSKVHAKNKYFVCKVCGVKFTSYYRLGRHMKVVHKDSEYVCDVCNKTFHTTQTLYRHQKSYHEIELGVKICLTCGARLTSVAALKEHVSQHFNMEDLSCKQCDTTFTTMAALNDHNLFHKKQEYKCIDCGKSFPSQAELKVHVSTDHVGMLLCQRCDEAFETEALLSIHNQLHHEKTNSDNYRCMDCGQCFNTSSELKVHVTLKHLGQVNTDNDNLKYTCIDCCEKFDEKQALKAHITLSHAGTTSCNECYTIFPTIEELDGHECEGNRHACKQCNAKFKQKSDLEEHMISHVSINVNEHYCTLCNKQFPSVAEKDRHNCSKGKAEAGDGDALSQMLSCLESLGGSLVNQIAPSGSKIKHAESPSKTARTTQLLSALSLLNRANLLSDTLIPSLSDIPTQTVSDLISIFNNSQDLISNLAKNPPKLPDSLIPDQKRVSPNLPTVTPIPEPIYLNRPISEQNSIIEKLAEKLIMGKDGFPEPVPVTQHCKSVSPLKDFIKCERCGVKFESKQLLAEHLQACSSPSTLSTTSPKKQKNKPDLKLIHRQLFIAAQNTDVSLLNIRQVETLIQVLASEDGIKKVPQERVIDLLDAIEKSVKIKEAKERTARKQKLLSSASSSPLSQSQESSPKKTAAQSSPSKSSTGTPPHAVKPSSRTATNSPKPPSLTDCLPPEITAAILPAIKEEKTDEVLLKKITEKLGQSPVTPDVKLANEINVALTKSIQILKHPDNTNKNTLTQLKSIILSILGPNSSSDKSIRQGMVNVLKRRYRGADKTNFAVLEQLIQFFVSDVLPTIEDLSPNHLTLPFLFDLVLKNEKKP